MCVILVVNVNLFILDFLFWNWMVVYGNVDVFYFCEYFEVVFIVFMFGVGGFYVVKWLVQVVYVLGVDEYYVCFNVMCQV